MAQIYYYDPQSAGINVQSPQSESTPRRLTLSNTPTYTIFSKTHKSWIPRTLMYLSTLYQGECKLPMYVIHCYIIVRLCGTVGTESILPWLFPQISELPRIPFPSPKLAIGFSKIGHQLFCQCILSSLKSRREVGTFFLAGDDFKQLAILNTQYGQSQSE